MNWLDIVILVLLVLAAWNGWRTGLVRSVVMLGGVVGGTYLAGRFSPQVRDALTFIGDPSVATVAAFVVIFGGTLLAAWLVGVLLRTLAHAFMLGWLDTIGGMVLGVFTAALFLTALIIAVGSHPIGPSASILKGSAAARWMADNMPFVMAMLPEEFRDVLGTFSKVERPTAQVSRVRVSDLSPSQVRITATLRLNNPNPFGANIRQVRYQVWHQQGGARVLLGEGEKKALRLKANGPTEVALEVVVRDAGKAGAVFAEASQRRAVALAVEGEAALRFPAEDMSLPFQARGEYPLE
ncbi:MAG: CvpA family protein [Dehalococcoidia bacterium]|nr:CvpA family protein [Dehalococcoidia bacterium]MDW8120616.1 CvpA family protein [Chloroflexota bacterium]